MSTLVSVTRYHLLDRMQYVILPIGVTAFSFAVNLVIFAVVNPPKGDAKTGGLATLYVFMFFVGIVAMVRALPFALTLGLSRRRFYLGTLLLAALMAAATSIGVVVLQAIERVTNGWGLDVHFFRISWFLSGSWYATLATAFVVAATFMVYGLWYGLIFRRWNSVGIVAFVAAQILVILAVILAIAWTDAWGSVGDFFTSLSAMGLTGLLAALTCILGAGGYATLRRIAV